MEKREFKTKVLKVFDEKDKGQQGIVKLMIVSWNDYPPQLVKQSFYFDEDDKLLPGKLKGIGLADWEILLKNKKKIMRLLGKDMKEKK